METESNTLIRFVRANVSWIIVGLLSLVFYTLTKRDRWVQKCFAKFTGPLTLPIIGSALSFVIPNDELVPLMFEFTKKYTSIFVAWIGNQGYVIICGAEEAEKILSSTIHTEKSTDYNLFHKWLGLGLLTAKPNKWHGRRKLLTPAFHFKILEEFLSIFNEQGNTFVDVLGNNEIPGQKFNIFPYITRCALDIICETAMGKKVNAQKGHGLEYVDAIYGYGEILIQKILRPWLQVGWIWNLSGNGKQEINFLKVLHNFSESIITARKSERKREMYEKSKNETQDSSLEELLPKRKKAFLDLLLDMADNEESGLTDLEIRNEVDTFMFEGHDTTAASLVWTIFLLGLYPEHQKKIQDELDEIFGDDKTRDLNAADISKMKYLELCIKESLRIYPSVPFFIRHINQDVELDDAEKRIIPSGVNVFISTISIHHNASTYPDPETFNPLRFLPENCVGRSPYAYIPFSAGPRNCIGQKFALMEEKVVLAKLFMNFEIQSIHSREEVKMVPDIILRPVDGIHVAIRHRK